MEQNLMDNLIRTHIDCLKTLLKQKTVMSKVGNKQVPHNQVIAYMNLEHIESVDGFAVGLLCQSSAEEHNTYGIFDLKTQRMFNNNPIDSFQLCEIDYANELHMESDILLKVADILLKSDFKIEIISSKPAEYDTTDKIRDLFDNFADFLIEKNNRYGDSALNPTKIFSEIDAGSQIRTRLDDKLQRIANSDELRKNDVCDVFGYVALLMIENGWLTFGDLLD